MVFRWNPARSVVIAPDMKMSQFDLIATPSGNMTSGFRKDGPYSVLLVSFHFKRHIGYFMIEIYAPCIMCVVLSWVSFWINREATADRVALGVMTVLTMTFLGLESRNDLPKVPYLTALDYFVALSFAFIFATIIEFAVVHYFTKVGSGEYYFSPAAFLQLSEAAAAREMSQAQSPHEPGPSRGFSSLHRLPEGIETGVSPHSDQGQEWVDEDEEDEEEGVDESRHGQQQAYDQYFGRDISELVVPEEESPWVLRPSVVRRRYAAQATEPAHLASHLRPSSSAQAGFTYSTPQDYESIMGVVRRSPTVPTIGMERELLPSSRSLAARQRGQQRGSQLHQTTSHLIPPPHRLTGEPSSSLEARPPARRSSPRPPGGETGGGAKGRGGRFSSFRQSFHRGLRRTFSRSRNQMVTFQLNSVSQIDRISRVVFPISFAIVNFFYWNYYLQAEDKLDAELLESGGGGASN